MQAPLVRSANEFSFSLDEWTRSKVAARDHGAPDAAPPTVTGACGSPKHSIMWVPITVIALY